MSNLTKTEKKALNELFIALKDKENILSKIKKTSISIIYYFVRLKKIKHPII